MPAPLRPREEFERVGAENVSDAVLLALILRTGSAEVNVIELAQRLLAQYGSLTGLARASVEELTRNPKLPGVGRVKAQMIKAAMELAQRLAREGVGERPVLLRPDQAAAVLRERARVLQHEVFWILMLDAKSRLIGEPRRMSEGILTSSLVHPRKLFRTALEHASASLILAHNHPSGDPSPSPEDIRITRQLIEAGKVMGIKVLDHLILGQSSPRHPSGFISLRESGLLKFE